MNSTVREAAKIIDELSQPNEKNDMKQNTTKNTKARLKESLKNGNTQSNAWPLH
jgi:hypothetical protein